MITDGKPHHEVILEAKQSALKQRFGRRVWGCKTCSAVLGVFNEDFTALDIDSQRVNLTVRGGEIERTCYRCDTTNRLTTRGRQDVMAYLAENDIKPVFSDEG